MKDIVITQQRQSIYIPFSAVVQLAILIFILGLCFGGALLSFLQSHN